MPNNPHTQQAAAHLLKTHLKYLEEKTNALARHHNTTQRHTHADVYADLARLLDAAGLLAPDRQ